jgi:dephospho-CoA kinase|tara:strand:+ start:183 stop:773 length:591 start_codon:yes stop_codon:yes gene_type:complete
MTFKLGLTGSMGMGKTSTAALFEKHNCGVWDADKAVHRLYSKGGEAVNSIQKYFPEAVIGGSVNRNKLKNYLQKDFDLITLLEDIVHPLVSEDRKKFIQNTKHKINVFDIPLLFETGSNKIMDKVACVFVPRTIQMERLRSRNTMQEAEIDKILKQQMPIEEKCSLSDFVIETYNTLDTELQVVKILREIEGYLNA